MTDDWGIEYINIPVVLFTTNANKNSISTNIDTDTYAFWLTTVSLKLVVYISYTEVYERSYRPTNVQNVVIELKKVIY